MRSRSPFQVETQDIEKSLIQLINRSATLENAGTPPKTPENQDDHLFTKENPHTSPADSATKVNEDLQNDLQ